MLRLLRLLIAIVALVVLVTLAVNNREPVTVSFFPLPFTYSTPIFYVFGVGLIIGCVVGWLTHVLSAHNRRVEYRQLKRQHVAEQVRQEVKQRQEEEAAGKKVRERQQALGKPGRAVAISTPAR